MAQIQGFNALSQRNKNLILVIISTMITDGFSFEKLCSLLDEKDKAFIDDKIENLLMKQNGNDNTLQILTDK